MPKTVVNKQNKAQTCTNGEPCRLNQDFITLKQEVEKLSELISTDTLTGLHNYRYFTEVISQELERSQRTGQATTLIMLDADHFKNVNDQWGHETGNKALQLIAHCIKDNIRKLDIPCRYGGEEFAVILPSTDIATSITVAERIRQAVEASTIKTENHNIKLTVSLGVSSYIGNRTAENNNSDNWHKLVERADKELYRAKEQGRNQTCHSPHEKTEQQVNEDEKSALFDIFK